MEDKKSKFRFFVFKREKLKVHEDHLRPHSRGGRLWSRKTRIYRGQPRNHFRFSVTGRHLDVTTKGKTSKTRYKDLVFNS